MGDELLGIGENKFFFDTLAAFNNHWGISIDP